MSIAESNVEKKIGEYGQILVPSILLKNLRYFLCIFFSPSDNPYA